MHDVVEHAVNTKPDAQLFLVRFDVNVRSAAAEGIDEQHIDETNDGCICALFFELERIDLLFLRRKVDIAVAQHSGRETRPFWTAALGYAVSGDVDSVDPLRRGPQLSFQQIRGDRTGRGRTHIDVSVPADLARARIDAAIAAGGIVVDDSYAPAWWTLASPDNHGVDIAAWTDTYE